MMRVLVIGLLNAVGLVPAGIAFADQCYQTTHLPISTAADSPIRSCRPAA